MIPTALKSILSLTGAWSAITRGPGIRSHHPKDSLTGCADWSVDDGWKRAAPSVTAGAGQPGNGHWDMSAFRELYLPATARQVGEAFGPKSTQLSPCKSTFDGEAIWVWHFRPRPTSWFSGTAKAVA